MKTLTAEEFLKITESNPQWASALTENVTVTGAVILPLDHPLQDLSPKLIFQDYAEFSESQISVGRGVFHRGVNFSHSKIQKIGELAILGTDEQGNAASFHGCKHLLVAEGTFPGFVDFSYSGIEKIAEPLHITAPDTNGDAASFESCAQLHIARGTFAGWVSFANSAIQKIAEDLRITAPDKHGNAASFWACANLTVAKGTFPGYVNFNGSAIREIAEDLCVTAPNREGNAADFRYCKSLSIARGKFRGTVDFSETPITCARNLKIIVPKGTPKAVFTQPCLKEILLPLKDVIVPKELEEKLRRKNIKKLNTDPKNHLPLLSKDI